MKFTYTPGGDHMDTLTIEYWGETLETKVRSWDEALYQARIFLFQWREKVEKLEIAFKEFSEEVH